ncbi:uncharacterized protein LOC142346107 isoform X3 [Convolutriloba macropyga]|uniref:uncharacterized protein LOC142346107 isoform X2 n=1 Tax=Convolutriloba macropyga TaxID=536237 RepID=UPI003F522C5B
MGADSGRGRGCLFTAVGLACCAVALCFLFLAFAQYADECSLNDGLSPVENGIYIYNKFFLDLGGLIIKGKQISSDEFKAALALHIISCLLLVSCVLLWSIIAWTKTYSGKSLLKMVNVILSVIALLAVLIAASLITHIFVGHRCNEGDEYGIVIPSENETMNKYFKDNYDKLKDVHVGRSCPVCYYDRHSEHGSKWKNKYYDRRRDYMGGDSESEEEETRNRTTNLIHEAYPILLWSSLLTFCVPLAMALVIAICPPMDEEQIGQYQQQQSPQTHGIQPSAHPQQSSQKSQNERRDQKSVVDNRKESKMTTGKQTVDSGWSRNNTVPAQTSNNTEKMENTSANAGECLINISR